VLAKLESEIASYLKGTGRQDAEQVTRRFLKDVVLEVLSPDAIVISPSIKTGFLKKVAGNWVPAKPKDWKGPGADPNVIRVDGSANHVRWFPWWGKKRQVAIVAQRPNGGARARGATDDTATAWDSYVFHEIAQHLLPEFLGNGDNAGHKDPALGELEKRLYAE